MSEKLLVATTDKSFLKTFESQIREHHRGYECVAVDHADKIPLSLKEKPDLVIMDIRMPNLRVDEYLTRIRYEQQNTNLPVILLTLMKDANRIESIHGSFCRSFNYIMPERRSASFVEKLLQMINHLLDPDLDKKLQSVSLSENNKQFLVLFQNDKFYTLNRHLLEQDDGSPIKTIKISRDAYSFRVSQASSNKYHVPWDAVLHFCEPTYRYYYKRAEKTRPQQMESMGARIKQIRKQKGLTQQQLAERTGMERSNIARIEAGRHRPTLPTLERIADALEVPVVELILKAG
jgi:DNA-binding XRE family transcriptional regulator/CheY-like chemotaxis protein